MKYKLNVARDVDVDGYGDEVSYILNLPTGKHEKATAAHPEHAAINRSSAAP